MKSALVETHGGAFVRTDSVHRSSIGTTTQFPAEHGRYLLVASYACPWAHRCIAIRLLLGLEEAVPLCIVHPMWAHTKPDVDDHRGWVFSNPSDAPREHPSGENHISCEGCVLPPSQYNKDEKKEGSKRWTSVRSIYDASGAHNAKKFTVPVLWDTKSNRIVNNESSEIIRMLYDVSMLGQFATKNKDLNFYPIELHDKIDAINAFVYTSINDGVYKCGFSHSQAAYEKAAIELLYGLQHVESILSQSKYLCSDSIMTEADIRLFVTLIRHDEVYVVYFKCNHCPIVGGTMFPNIVRYMKLMLSIPEVAASVNMQHIKHHYYTSHPTLNPYGVVPLGQNVLQSLM